MASAQKMKPIGCSKWKGDVSSMKKGLVALVNENEIVYTLGIFRGHCFREYPDGKIEAADEQEIQLLKKFED